MGYFCWQCLSVFVVLLCFFLFLVFVYLCFSVCCFFECFVTVFVKFSSACCFIQKGLVMIGLLHWSMFGFCF